MWLVDTMLVSTVLEHRRVDETKKEVGTSHDKKCGLCSVGSKDTDDSWELMALKLAWKDKIKGIDPEVGHGW